MAIVTLEFSNQPLIKKLLFLWNHPGLVNWTLYLPGTWGREAFKAPWALWAFGSDLREGEREALAAERARAPEGQTRASPASPLARSRSVRMRMV